VSSSPETIHADLVLRVAQGDAAAEAQIIEHFAPRVRVMMIARLRDPDLARDLAQDALIALVQALRRGQLRETDRLAAFVHGLARNVFNNYIRTRSRRGIEEPIDDDVAGVEPADTGEERERMALLERGLSEVSPSDREILQMTLVDGLKPGQIADRLGLTAEVVRARKSRAQKRVMSAIDRLSRTARADHSGDRRP